MRWIFDPTESNSKELSIHYQQGDDVICSVCSSPILITGHRASGLIAEAVCSKDPRHYSLTITSAKANETIKEAFSHLPRCDVEQNERTKQAA